MITQCWANGMVTLQCGAIQIRYNIHHIYPHTSDEKFEDIKCWKIFMTIVNIWVPVLKLFFIFKLGTKCLIGCSWRPWHIFISVLHVDFFMTLWFSSHELRLFYKSVIIIYIWYPYDVHIPLLMGGGVLYAEQRNIYI